MTKGDTAFEKLELARLLAVMRSNSGTPMSKSQWKQLGKLAKKYKYDSQFRDDLFVSGVKG